MIVNHFLEDLSQLESDSVSRYEEKSSRDFANRVGLGQAREKAGACIGVGKAKAKTQGRILTDF